MSPCAHKEARRAAGALLSHPLPYSLETGSLTVPRGRLAASKAQQAFVCPSKHWGYLWAYVWPFLAFEEGAADLNSGSRPSSSSQVILSLVYFLVYFSILF